MLRDKRQSINSSSIHSFVPPTSDWLATHSPAHSLLAAFTAAAISYASALRYAVDKQHGVTESETSSSRALRYLKIGSAVVIGGVAIGLTGGLLAAPLLGAGLAGIGLASAGATVGTLVASTGGVVLVSSLFGIGQPTIDRSRQEAVLTTVD